MSNIDSIELAAASVEEATREALEQLGAREDVVAIEGLATPRAGVLGMGARQARVRVTRKSADAAGGVGGQAGSNPQVPQV
ncbi:Jag N-terminal domain-containing protein, partial [Candidatus Binatus sp.]|uniref:Jag N-terminal domain-containing protein n=1 Tax=Candidatus Binatus sp. TaxID=2811406 RepID=UPI003C531958